MANPERGQPCPRVPFPTALARVSPDPVAQFREDFWQQRIFLCASVPLREPSGQPGYPSSSTALPRMSPKSQTAAQLRSLQRLMARAVMRPLTATARMRPRWVDRTSTAALAASFIKPGPHHDSFERLEIYNRQYWFRVLECLADDYPGVRAVIGPTRFRNLATAYLATHPSSRFTLRDLGQHFPGFIMAEPRWTAPRTAVAADMARLEWSHIAAFDNEAKPPLTQADLSCRDPAKIRLRLQPHLTLLQLGWPLDEYLIALSEHTRLRGEASHAIADADRKLTSRKIPLPRPLTVRLAVHRHQNIVYYKRLTAEQFKLLTLLRDGRTLGRALQMVAPDEQTAETTEWFKDWATLGWFWVRH